MKRSLVVLQRPWYSDEFNRSYRMYAGLAGFSLLCVAAGDAFLNRKLRDSWPYQLTETALASSTEVKEVFGGTPSIGFRLSSERRGKGGPVFCLRGSLEGPNGSYGRFLSCTHVHSKDASLFKLAIKLDKDDAVIDVVTSNEPFLDQRTRALRS